MLVSTPSLLAIARSKLVFTYCFSAMTLMALMPLFGSKTIAAQTTLQSLSDTRYSQSPASTAGANSMARIDDASIPSIAAADAARFNSRSLPEAPSAPQSILMPQTPTFESFTETSADGQVGTESVRLPGDGSQAIGTFATQNPFVRQPNLGGPSDASTIQPAVPPITQNGLRGGVSHNQNQIMPTNPGFQATGSSTPSQFGNPPQRSFEDQTRRPFGSRLNEQSPETPPQPSFGNPARQSFGDSSVNSPEGLPRQPDRSSVPLIQPMRTERSVENTGGSRETVGFNAMSVDRSGIPVDNQIQPTAFNQEANLRTNPNALAMQLLSRYDVDNAPDPLPGRPTTLLEMLRQPIAANQRRAMVSQYWETYYDWATFLSRAEQLSWLSSISAPSSPADQALLRAAKSAASNQVLAAEIQLGKSQARLMDFLPASQADLLPLPADKPLVQKYNTNYELYQQNGMMPSRLRGIDGMLPKVLKLIQNRADTVQLARAAADDARKSLAARQTTLASVLEAMRIWRAAEQDMVASVTSYNQAIADYSLSIAQGGQTPEQLVAMLIAKPKVNQVANSYARPAQQARSSRGQYSQPAYGRSPANNPNAIGQPATGNFGPTGRYGGSNQGFGQNNDGNDAGQSFGSPNSLDLRASNEGSSAIPNGSTFPGNSGQNSQGFDGSPQRAANSQFNQFGR